MTNMRKKRITPTTMTVIIKGSIGVSLFFEFDIITPLSEVTLLVPVVLLLQVGIVLSHTPDSRHFSWLSPIRVNTEFNRHSKVTLVPTVRLHVLGFRKCWFDAVIIVSGQTGASAGHWVITALKLQEKKTRNHIYVYVEKKKKLFLIIPSSYYCECEWEECIDVGTEEVTNLLRCL